MSCTVLAVPYALAWIVGTVITTAVAAANSNTSKAKNYTKQYEDMICEDFHTITENDLMEKDFETPFIDTEILKKTLEEHGIYNIQVSENNISGQQENYKFNFTRENTNEPYKLRISYNQENSVREKIEDLNSEYALNVQEDAYLQIVEKLKENNMQIESEEVKEDNTIVLTVNLE